MFDVERVLNSWRQEVDAINSAVAGLSDEAAHTAIRPDAWSIHDVLGHMTSTTRAFLLMCRSVEPTGRTFPQDFDRDGWNEQQRVRNEARPFDETLRYWQRTTKDVVGFLETMDPTVVEREAVIPWLPQVQTIGDVLRVLILHTRGHRTEITDGLVALHAKEA